MVCGGVLVGVALLVAGFHYFPHWNEERLVRRARLLIAQKNYNSATLTARRILQLNNRNVGAATLMAEMADLEKAKECLYWYHRLVELQPERLENYLKLADRSLAYGNVTLAGQALAQISDRAEDSGLFHELNGKWAAATRQPSKAEAEFAEALRLDPQNITYKFDWATQSLESQDAEKRAEARGVVSAHLQDREFSSRAYRTLISDALRSRDWDRALTLGKELDGASASKLDDRLVYLSILHDLKRPTFPDQLTVLEEQVIKSPQDTFTLLSWLNANGGALLGIEWSKRLPNNLASTMPVPVAISQAYVALGDWAGLRPIVVDSPDDSAQGNEPTPPLTNSHAQKREWAAYEFMRLALASRTLREQGELNASRIQWNAALKAIAGRPEALNLLARATVDWGWESESTDLLWAIGRGSQDPRWALNLLYTRYLAAKSTRSLLAVVTRMYEIDPSDPWVQNNFAEFNFLLQSNVDEGLVLARKLYEKEPQNPVYASTYAFGMHLHGSTRESLTIMRSLGSGPLGDPGFCAYFFCFLVAEGEYQEAQTLNDRLNLSALLPEEAALVSKARSRLSETPVPQRAKVP